VAVETIVQYGGVFKKEIFGKGSRVKFEDDFFSAPEKSMQYLEQTYGDYMKLPPENKRTTHKMVAYYK
jgi:lipopolysaccharide cholinephosphotransferase